MLYAIFLVMMAVATTILLLVLPEESANPISRTVEEEGTNLNYIFQIGANFKNRVWKIFNKILSLHHFRTNRTSWLLRCLLLHYWSHFSPSEADQQALVINRHYCTNLLFFYLSANFIFSQKKLIQNLKKRWTGSKWT